MVQTRTAQKGPAAAGDRADTEARLGRAAIDLIDRDGILAGLNLREVADEAQVNRGLIYHYFGGRRELLRSAINRIIDSDRAVSDARPLEFGQRRRRMFDVLAKAPRFARLTALLALDGDDNFRAFPHLDTSIEDLERDVATGHLPPEADVVALHVVTSATMRGYAIFREAFARDLRIPVDELDRRAGDAFELLLAGVDPSAHH